jgi:hypothetical protein
LRPNCPLCCLGCGALLAGCCKVLLCWICDIGVWNSGVGARASWGDVHPYILPALLTAICSLHCAVALMHDWVPVMSMLLTGWLLPLCSTAYEAGMEGCGRLVSASTLLQHSCGELVVCLLC